ncbi:hypothetical protein PUN28_012653 [Cardiocondyla obscurior]|uniref:Uncharacterized protein n=1 Tax=Cardiocondyla obscurior TaxID=286306 RepID=A0AAW2FDU2_9HYME
MNKCGRLRSLINSVESPYLRVWIRSLDVYQVVTHEIMRSITIFIYNASRLKEGIHTAVIKFLIWSKVPIVSSAARESEIDGSNPAILRSRANPPRFASACHLLRFARRFTSFLVNKINFLLISFNSQKKKIWYVLY